MPVRGKRALRVIICAVFATVIAAVASLFILCHIYREPIALVNALEYAGIDAEELTELAVAADAYADDIKKWCDIAESDASELFMTETDIERAVGLCGEIVGALGEERLGKLLYAMNDARSDVKGLFSAVKYADAYKRAAKLPIAALLSEKFTAKGVASGSPLGKKASQSECLAFSYAVNYAVATIKDISVESLAELRRIADKIYRAESISDEVSYKDMCKLARFFGTAVGEISDKSEVLSYVSKSFVNVNGYKKYVDGLIGKDEFMNTCAAVLKGLTIEKLSDTVGELPAYKDRAAMYAARLIADNCADKRAFASQAGSYLAICCGNDFFTEEVIFRALDTAYYVGDAIHESDAAFWLDLGNRVFD